MKELSKNISGINRKTHSFDHTIKLIIDLSNKITLFYRC